jgi:hypothetical protein
VSESRGTSSLPFESTGIFGLPLLSEVSFGVVLESESDVGASGCCKYTGDLAFEAVDPDARGAGFAFPAGDGVLADSETVELCVAPGPPALD